jgi:hypothetical protein
MGTKPENHEQLGEWSGKPFFNKSGTLKRRIQDYQIIQGAGWLVKLKRPRFILSKFYARIVEKNKTL